MNNEYKQADMSLIPAMLYRTPITQEEFIEYFMSLYDYDTKSIYITEKYLNEIVEFFKWNFTENKITYRIFRHKGCKDKKPTTLWQKIKFFLFSDPTNEFLRIYLDEKHFVDLPMVILSLETRWQDIYLFLTKQVNALKKLVEIDENIKKETKND